ncbi:MAG: hypothetical protein ACMUHM_00785 [Thermoplasmatota archaeon]
MGKRRKGAFVRSLSWILRMLERFRDRYPIEKAKRHSAFLMILILGVPLLLLSLLIHIPILLWDLFDPWNIDVPNLVHLCFGFIYVGIAVFTGMEIREFWGVLEIVYHPIKALKDDAVESIIKPVREGLIKIDIVVGLIILAVVTTDSISIYFTGFTGFHLAAYIIIFIIGGVMLALSTAIYLLIKGALVLLIDVIYSKMDKKFHISDNLKEFYDKVRSEDVVIDVEAK